MYSVMLHVIFNFLLAFAPCTFLRSYSYVLRLGNFASNQTGVNTILGCCGGCGPKLDTTTRCAGCEEVMRAYEALLFNHVKQVKEEKMTTEAHLKDLKVVPSK